MNIFIDKEKLEKLLNSFFVITGIKFGIYDTNFKEIYTAGKRCDFCTLIQDTEYGLNKCFNCDAEALRLSKQKGEIIVYRCHAGLLESAAPIIESGEVIAYISFGQILDDSTYEDQWQYTLEKCKWHHDPETLKKYFFTIERISHLKLTAYSEITIACTSYIWLKRVIKAIQQTEAQKLISYIEQNYNRNIALDEIAKALSVSKTKICLIAQKQLGATVGKLLLNKRIEIAKSLLLTTNLSITEISEKIGISDYNYFGKIFHHHIGISPSLYRKKYKANYYGKGCLP